MLWVDKHRPKTLDALDYHKPLAANMKRMIASGDFPHMLFYGPSGAGKKTRVMALLRQLHGPSVEKLKVEARTFKFGSSSTTTDLTMVTSSHHIELNPSDAGIRDRCARARTRAPPSDTRLTDAGTPFVICQGGSAGAHQGDRFVRADHHRCQRWQRCATRLQGGGAQRG